MLNRRHILTHGAGAIALAVSAGTALSATDFGIRPDIARDQSKKVQTALDAAARKGGVLHLPAGLYVVRNLTISAGMHLSGVPGQTRLALARNADNILSVSGARGVTIEGIVFDGNGQALASDRAGLLGAEKVRDFIVRACGFRNSRANGMVLHGCDGHIVGNHVERCEVGGIFSMDSGGLEIGHNRVEQIGDNGILVWQSQKRADGSLVHHNQIHDIRGKSGGNGQYGNGISVFRAGNVVVSDNRISRCRFSAVRDNAGDNIQIVNNNCSQLDEVAIFVEFGFSGAVVSGNMIEKAGMGISITNFNEGGRLAVCANNTVRDMLGAVSNPETQPIGIAVEADTAVTGNVVENAKRGGIWIGWGKYLRNVNASGNMIRNCDLGITLSFVKGARSVLVANNLIDNAVMPIAGMDHDKLVSGDLSSGKGVPAGFQVTGNMVSGTAG